MRRSFILICLATLLSFCLKAQTLTPPEVTFQNLATKYAPGFPADVKVWVTSNDYIDSLCKVSYTVKKDGRVISNIADYGTVSYRIRLTANAYTEWTPITTGSGNITQEVEEPNSGSRIVVESFTLGIFEHTCVDRGRPIEFKATFDEIGVYSIDVNVAQVTAVAPYLTELPSSFYCNGSDVEHKDKIALTSTVAQASIATAHIEVNVVPSYAVNFVGLGAGNEVTVDAPAHRDSVMQGDNYVFSISRVACQTGMTVTVDGQTLAPNGAGKYTIANVQSDKTVNVVFQANATYAISNGGDARISVQSPVNCGSDAVVTITPGANERISWVKDNGTDVTASLVNNTYTIPNVQAEHTITAGFEAYEYPTLSFGQIDDKYAPGFPANVVASINSHGYLDKLCMVEYVVSRNGQPVANLADYGSVHFSVRLQGTEEIERELTAGTGVVNETVEYNGHTYEINAFTASIFDNSTCLNRWRPITFTAAFTEIGSYEVTVNLYKAIVDNDIQISDLGTTYINTCAGNVEGRDKVAMNARKGDLIATLSQTVNVVPSYAINFVGLGAENVVTADLPAHRDSVMQGDDYVFSISMMDCQSGIARVTVDGNELTPNGNKYTIANVRSDKTVNVEFTTSTFAITTNDSHIAVPSSRINCGEDAVVTITPASDYVIATLTDNGNAVDIATLVNNTYTITNVKADHVIAATYERVETPTLSFDNVAEKYAPGFPANVVARINSHGYIDQLCMVEYEVTRNGEPIANISEYGSVKFSVRLQGDNEIERQLTAGTGIVNETVDFEGNTYEINAFTASIFDNSSCLDRNRPITFLATFTEIGNYQVTVNLYKAVVDYPEYQVSDLGTTYLNACNGNAEGRDRVAMNARKGDLLTTLSQSVNVVPSFAVNFIGVDTANLTVDLPAHKDSVMQGDDYVFSISLMDCQSSVTSVTVDGATLNENNGKYTIANVREDKTVTVTFASQVYVVSAQVNDENAGTVTPQMNSVNCGEDAVVTVSPAANYEVASVTDNNNAVTLVDNTYIINNIAENHQIVVTFAELTRPTISFEDVADKYAPGFPADVVARINSHADREHADRLDQLCKVEYNITRNGETIENIADFGTVSFSVRLAGNSDITRDLTSGHGFVSETVPYEGQNYDIDAFTVGIFDNSDCLHRDRAFRLHATFNQTGTYVVNVKLWSAEQANTMYLDTINRFMACDGLEHADRIAIGATSLNVLDELSQTINVVPSYAITFNGLAEGNSVALVDADTTRVRLDSIMEGENYKFRINLVGCQDEVSRLTVNGNIVLPEGDVYTIADVREDLNIEVAFSAHSYTITASAGANGTAEVDAPVVTCGENAVVTITPDANYEIATITDNDNAVSAVGNTYTIENVTENHNVVVTFAEMSHPTLSLEDVADKYAPGFPADVIARINSHATTEHGERLDQLCKIEYNITRNGEQIESIADFGTVSFTVRLAGSSDVTRDVTNGHGFVSENVEYEGVNYPIDAFTVGIFDNSDCQHRDRPIRFHATFNQTGTYVVNVKLWSAEQINTQFVDTINTFLACDGQTHADRIAINATALNVLDEISQTINVVPSYAITFNGLAEGNSVDLVDVDTTRVRLDSIMEGENYKFRINLIDGCQDEVSRVTVNGNIVLPESNVYTVADVREDLNIEVAFSTHMYSITATAGANGTATVNVPVVSCGGTAVVTITPDANCSIATVMDGSTDVTAAVENGTYTIENVTADHSVEVTFVVNALPTITFEPLASEKYAPNFPVEATARINSNGFYDRMCKVEYTIKRNGRVISNVSDFGSVSYSVRLAGDNPITRDITAGSGFVSESVDYEGETYQIDAFSVGIFDNYACLNRNRPINFVASFTEIGYYEVTVNLYDAIYRNEYIDSINRYADCNGEQHYDMIAINTTEGAILATETISVEVVPSFKITFVGLEDGNEVVADAPAHADSVMYGDNYVFAINGLVGCQTGIESVEVDGNTLTAENGKYTIADVRENKTVNVTFALQSFAITASTDGNGVATVENANVTCGDTATVTFTANQGYELASVTDGDTDVTAQVVNNTYTITNVTEPHAIVANFTQVVLPEIVVDESTIAEKYAPGFPADIVANINTHGNYDRICKIGYSITRNGVAVERVSDFGTASYSVRLAGTEPVTRDVVTGSGFVSEIVNYNDQPYSIDAFSAGIFDNSECLNRNRPINFHATFTQPGEYKVVISMYAANYTDGQISVINHYSDCNGVQHDDMIGYNTSAGELLASKEIAVNVVPSYVVTFEGLVAEATHTSYEPANGDTIMEGDNYIFSLEVADATTACQPSVDKVTVDGAELTATDGKYTIANVTSDKVVNVTFTYPTYAITATATNGTANVDPAEVACGETATVTFTADAGYELASVTDGDTDVTAQVVNGTYVIENVMAAHNVVAIFNEIVNPTIAFDSIAPKYAPGFPADVIGRINSEGNPDRMVKVGYEVTRNGQLVERISDYGTLSYTVRLAGTNTITKDIEEGNGFISERVDYEGATYYIDAFTVGIFDNNTCVNRNRPVELHAAFDSIGEYNVTIKLYDVDTSHALVDEIGSFDDCNGIHHIDKIAISARATNEIVSLTQTVNVVPSYAITFEGLAEGNNHESYAPANGDSIMQGDNFIFSLDGFAACQTGVASVATADGATLTADADGKYTIENVQSDMTVVVTYEYETFAITTTTDGNGTAVATPENVTCGDSTVVVITPNDNYTIASVTLDGNDVTANVVDNEYVIFNVTEAHTVAVTFRNAALPTITIDEYAENYAPAYPADIVGHVNSNENFDRMVKLGYTITRNGQEITNIADYGSMSYSVRLAGTQEVTKDITAGSGFISESVEYEGETYNIDAFTVGIFDNNPCANRNRPVTFHAEFDSIGTYVVNVKLYDADTTNAMVDNIASFTDCHGVRHNDKIALNAVALDTVASATFTINVVPSYIITFEGLEEGNTYASLDTIHGDTVMMGNNYSFTLGGTAACQSGIASVATDVAVLEAVDGVYTIENVQSDMVVTVTYNYQTFAITAVTDGNGTAVVTPENVTCGDSAVVVITPNENYELATVMLDSVDVTANVVDSTYVIYNVTAEHTVSVTFNQIPYYTVTFVGLEDENEVVSATGDTVRHGDNYVFSINGLAQCQAAIDTVYVGGQILNADENGIYTIENVVSDTTVTVTFRVATYSIAVTADNNGTVVVTPETIACGDSAVIVITPNENYEIESVTLDSLDITAEFADSTYTLLNVIANHTLNVTFVSIPSYVITFEGLVEGNTHVVYEPATGDTVMRGENYIFGLEGLADCQEAIDSVSVNGQLLVADDEGHYTIENVQSDLTVNVTYVTRTFTIAMFAGDHGSVAADTAVVECGSDYEVVFTPAAGYQIGTVTMDSTDVTDNVSGNSLMLTDIHDNHTVSATFVIIPPESPYAEFVGLENTYESGDTIDFEVKLHANRVLDNLCAVGYQLKYYDTDTTSTVVADATRYGVFNYSVNITDSTFASNTIQTGSGLLNATAQYGNNTYNVSAFTLGLFDSECAGRDRDIDFNAVFSRSGRYQFELSLYTCANGGTAVGTRYEACDGMIHYDRVDAVCDSMTIISTTSQEIEITGETLYTITASVIGGHGTVDPDGTIVVDAGTDHNVTFFPDEGYALDTVIVNGMVRYPVDGPGYISNNIYPITNISENYIITVKYRDVRAYYNIHVEIESAGGTVSPMDTTVVDGADVTLIVTPNAGFHISQLEIDGNMVTNCETNEIRFPNVQADHLVRISFMSNSINEEAFSDLSVYPNPNNGKFTVSSSEFDGEVTLQLFNASGAAIEEMTLTNQEYVDVDRNLPTGTYILRIISGDKVATRKIVVE